MKRIKIEREVTKEDVYVFTQCEKDYQKVTEIITRSGESLIGKDDYFVTYSPLNGYWVTLDSIGDKHQITIPQLAELLGVEYPLKSKFEVGKWYKRSCDKSLMYFNGDFNRDGDPCGYGLLHGDVWIDANDLGWGGYFIPATHQEVEDALVAEANRRYKSGDHVKIMVGPCEGKKSSAPITCNNLSLESGMLWCKEGIRQYTLFKDGVWAEVLEEEEPKLPTLEELIEEAKSKITEKTTVYPDWFDGTKGVTSYVVAGTEYMSEKLAIIGYISKRLREEYL